MTFFSTYSPKPKITLAIKEYNIQEDNNAFGLSIKITSSKIIQSELFIYKTDIYDKKKATFSHVAHVANLCKIRKGSPDKGEVFFAMAELVLSFETAEKRLEVKNLAVKDLNDLLADYKLLRLMPNMNKDYESEYTMTLIGN